MSQAVSRLRWETWLVLGQVVLTNAQASIVQVPHQSSVHGLIHLRWLLADSLCWSLSSPLLGNEKEPDERGAAVLDCHSK